MSHDRGWQPSRSLTPRGKASTESLDWVKMPSTAWRGGFHSAAPESAADLRQTAATPRASTPRAATSCTSSHDAARCRPSTSSFAAPASSVSAHTEAASVEATSSLARGAGTPRSAPLSSASASRSPTGSSFFPGAWMGTSGNLMTRSASVPHCADSSSVPQELTPRAQHDGTWTAASSRMVRNTLGTPRGRSMNPHGKEYGAPRGRFASIVMPRNAGDRTPRATLSPRRTSHELELEASSKDHKVRDAALRQRVLERRGLISSSIARAEARMPRGRNQMGSSWSSSPRLGSAGSSADGSRADRGSASGTLAQMRTWHEPSNGRRADATTTTAQGWKELQGSPLSGASAGNGVSGHYQHNAVRQPNAFAYKAALDQGRLKVLTNWRQGFEGRGAERYHTGELYVGDIRHGDRDGSGVYQHTNGQLLLSRWRQNEPVGEGVQWSADRKHAVRVLDGRPTAVLSKDEAKTLASSLGAPEASTFQSSKPSTWGFSHPVMHAIAGGAAPSAAESFEARNRTQGDELLAYRAERQSRQQRRAQLGLSPRSPDKKHKQVTV